MGLPTSTRLREAARAGSVAEAVETAGRVSARVRAGATGDTRPAGCESVPHLGLGLYIVRLVAEFHGGEAEARNRDDGTGVEVHVSLPTARRDEPRLSAAEAWEARKGSSLEP